MQARRLELLEHLRGLGSLEMKAHRAGGWDIVGIGSADVVLVQVKTRD